MSFQLSKYKAPEFNKEPWITYPEAKRAKVVLDGVSPEGYHAMSIYPEYFKIGKQWILPNESRMDCVAVVRDEQTIEIVEFRNLKVGDEVVLGRTEDGTEGIYLYNKGFV